MSKKTMIGFIRGTVVERIAAGAYREPQICELCGMEFMTIEEPRFCPGCGEIFEPVQEDSGEQKNAIDYR